MVARAVLILGVLVIGLSLAAERADALASTDMYIDLSFYATVRDTIRDTTYFGSSATSSTAFPTVYLMAATSGSREDMWFSLYSQPEGGSDPVWTEFHEDVPIENGYVHVVLGPLNKSLFPPVAPLYLEIKITNDILTPRIPTYPPNAVVMMCVASGDLGAPAVDLEDVRLMPQFTRANLFPQSGIILTGPGPKMGRVAVVTDGDAVSRSSSGTAWAEMRYQLDRQSEIIRGLESQLARLHAASGKKAEATK